MSINNKILKLKQKIILFSFSCKKNYVFMYCTTCFHMTSNSQNPIKLVLELNTFTNFSTLWGRIVEKGFTEKLVLSMNNITLGSNIAKILFFFRHLENRQIYDQLLNLETTFVFKTKNVMSSTTKVCI